MFVLQIYGHLLQIYGYAPTDLWSRATKIWCYPQAARLTATNLWCWRITDNGSIFCYGFMVLAASWVVATDLWSRRFCYRFMADGPVRFFCYGSMVGAEQPDVITGIARCSK